MAAAVIVSPIHIIPVETPQYQVEATRADRNTQINRNVDPVAGRAVVVTVHDVLESIPGPVSQFCAEQNVARRETAPQVTPDHRTADPVFPVYLRNEPVFVNGCIGIDVESVTVDIVVVIAVIIRVEVKIKIDIEILCRSFGRCECERGQ